jgi:hypothetical protein
MIKLFIPKTKFLFNNQYDLMDQEGILVYRHRSNYFQTNRFIVNAENKVIMNSKTVLGFREKFVITQNNRFITEVSYKSIWNRKIVLEDGLSVKINGRMQFTIFRNDEEVLSITKSKQKEYFRIVQVTEDQTDFLIMLMFTIIVMLDNTVFT